MGHSKISIMFNEPFYKNGCNPLCLKSIFRKEGIELRVSQSVSIDGSIKVLERYKGMNLIFRLLI